MTGAGDSLTMLTRKSEQYYVADVYGGLRACRATGRGGGVACLRPLWAKRACQRHPRPKGRLNREGAVDSGMMGTSAAGARAPAISEREQFN